MVFRGLVIVLIVLVPLSAVVVTVALNVTWGDSLPRDVFAFVSMRGGDHDIYLYDLTTDEITNITQHPRIDSRPAWSPDGSLLAFNTFRYPGGVHIALYDPAPGRLVRVTYEGATNYLAGWSPDGRWLLCHCERDDEIDIYLINPFTGDEVNLTNTPDAMDTYPRWSPDGSQIAFMGQTPDSSRWYVRIIDVATGEVSPLIIPVMSNDPAFRWGDDGESLIFRALYGDHQGYFKLSLGCDYLNTDCRQQMQPLSDAQAAAYYAPGRSPDGSQHVYALVADGSNPDIFLTDADGSTRQLTDHPAIDHSPVWRPG